VANDQDDSDVPGLLPDVPETGSALALSHDEATALALKMAGEPPPDECRFHCIMCGWNKTLKFEEEEIEALGGDITSYGGPCGGCKSMTLVPYNKLAGDHGKSILDRARENQREEAEIHADVLVDRVKEEVSTIFGKGAMPSVGGDDTDEEEDLPEAADISGMTPRTEG
jgi:hypothetical protein